jgi:dUTP pyrophosphatase
MLTIKVEGNIPKKAHDSDAGYDLTSSVDCEIKSGQCCVIFTGTRIELPPGFEAQVRSRSGLALKKSVFVLNSPGTIDPDYRGEIGVILQNLGSNPFYVQKGDRIAQMVIGVIVESQLVAGEVNETKRGENGFGSTGR